MNNGGGNDFIRECLILEATEAISLAMEKAGVNKKELADLLNRSPAHVTKVLQGRNLTLRTIAHMLEVLGYEAKITLKPKGRLLC